jgi:hypothetical protein
MSLGPRRQSWRWRTAHGLIAAAALVLATAATMTTAAASTGFGPSLAQPWVVAPQFQPNSQPGHGAISWAVAYLGETMARPAEPSRHLLRLNAF